jgi:ERF superfamily
MPETGSLAAALVQLQAALPPITKDDTAQVGPRTYAYANLATIHAVILPVLASLGLCWTCKPTIRHDGQFVLRYTLKHAPSGEYEDGDYPLPASGTPQQVGSAITYAKRYTICAVLGIAPAEDDDDGQAAETSYGARVATQAAKEAYQDWNPPAEPRTRKPTRSRGELGDDEWTTEPAEGADAPGSITDAQGKRIHARFTKLGVTDRDARLAYTRLALGLDHLQTSNDLSMAQASELIRKLEDTR